MMSLERKNLQWLRTWHCYLEGENCVVVIDHNPLTYWKSQQILSRFLARWLEYLQKKFTYKYEYRPRHINIANPLSHNLLRSNDYVNVLSHDSLRCRDVRLKTLLATSYLMLSFGKMAIEI